MPHNSRLSEIIAQTAQTALDTAAPQNPNDITTVAHQAMIAKDQHNKEFPNHRQRAVSSLAAHSRLEKPKTHLSSARESHGNSKER